MYPFFYIFSCRVPAYGAMMALGLLVAGSLGLRRARKAGLRWEDGLVILACGFGTALLGAAGLYLAVTYSPAQLWALICSGELFSENRLGLVFYGGLIFGASRRLVGSACCAGKTAGFCLPHAALPAVGACLRPLGLPACRLLLRRSDASSRRRDVYGKLFGGSHRRRSLSRAGGGKRGAFADLWRACRLYAPQTAAKPRWRALSAFICALPFCAGIFSLRRHSRLLFRPFHIAVAQPCAVCRRMGALFSAGFSPMRAQERRLQERLKISCNHEFVSVNFSTRSKRVLKND